MSSSSFCQISCLQNAAPNHMIILVPISEIAGTNLCQRPNVVPTMMPSNVSAAAPGNNLTAMTFKNEAEMPFNFSGSMPQNNSAAMPRRKSSSMPPIAPKTMLSVEPFPGKNLVESMTSIDLVSMPANNSASMPSINSASMLLNASITSPPHNSSNVRHLHYNVTETLLPEQDLSVRPILKDIIKYFKRLRRSAVKIPRRSHHRTVADPRLHSSSAPSKTDRTARREEAWEDSPGPWFLSRGPGFCYGARSSTLIPCRTRLRVTTESILDWSSKSRRQAARDPTLRLSNANFCIYHPERPTIDTQNRQIPIDLTI